MLPPQLPYDNQEGEANNERGWSAPDSWPPKTDNMPMSDPHDEEEPHTDDVLGEPLRPSSATSSLFDDDVVLNPHTLRRDSMDTSHHLERASPAPPSATTDQEIYPKRPYPPRAPRELHRPRTVLHRPPPSLRARASSSTATTTVTFPCTFAFAGCEFVYASKDAWKQHVANNHMIFVYWECPLKPCPRPLFGTEDRLKEHLRWVHSPRLGVPPESRDRQIAALVKRGERPGRSLIKEMRCPVPGCSEGWKLMGGWSWDDRMEHVARHWEQVARGVEGGGWTEEGGGLLEWAIREGAVREVEGGKLVCEEGMGRRAWNDRIGHDARHLDAVSRGEEVGDSTEESLGAMEPKNPNDETKITYDDASGPWASSIAPSHWNDNVVLDPFTFPKGMEYTSEQMTRDEEKKSIDDEIFDAPPRTTDPTTHQTTNRGDLKKLSVKFVSEHQAEPHRPSSVKSMTLDYASDEVPSDIDIDPPADDSDVDTLPETTNPAAPRRRNSGDRRPVSKRLPLFNYRVADPTLVRYRDPDTKETAHPEPGSHPAPPQPPSAEQSVIHDDSEFPDPPPSGLRGGSPLSSVLDDDEDVFTSVDAALDAEDKAPLDEKQMSRLRRVFSRRIGIEKGKGDQKGKDKDKEKGKGKGKGKDKEDDGGRGGRRRSVLGF